MLMSIKGSTQLRTSIMHVSLRLTVKSMLLSTLSLSALC